MVSAITVSIDSGSGASGCASGCNSDTLPRCAAQNASARAGALPFTQTRASG